MSKAISLFDGTRMNMHESIKQTLQMLLEYGPLYDRWAIAWSGGKDSTTVVTLVIYLIMSKQLTAPPKGIEILYADTRMELLPLVAACEDIRADLEEAGFSVRSVMAELDKRFLVYMLGRGVPPSNSQTFRWCTRLIKTEPMRDALAEQVKNYGNILVLTGVRIGESAARDQRIAVACSSKNGTECGSAHFQALANPKEPPRFYQPAGPSGLATLAPIIHWRICHVWAWLSDWAPQPEFGGWETRMLAEAYGGRNGDEAEEIGARTGCVGCPLVERDQGLEAVLKMPRWAYLAPLRELRGLYAELRLPTNRLRQPTVEKLANGKYSQSGQRMGALTMEARTRTLTRILEIQSRVNAHPDVEAGGRPKLDILNGEEVARIRALIDANTWPEGWTGEEPEADKPIPRQYVVEGEDGQIIEEQGLLPFW